MFCPRSVALANQQPSGVFGHPLTLQLLPLMCCNCIYVCWLQGEHAHRIWSAIYNQSCFTDGVSCSEERVFYRLISGMHASISCHLSSDYLLDEQKGIWGPNMTEFRQRLGTPETRCDRVLQWLLLLVVVCG
jgi:hypothetical protein